MCASVALYTLLIQDAILLYTADALILGENDLVSTRRSRFPGNKEVMIMPRTNRRDPALTETQALSSLARMVAAYLKDGEHQSLPSKQHHHCRYTGYAVEPGTLAVRVPGEE